MNLIDSHAHIMDEQFDDVEEVISRAKAAGILSIVTAGDCLSSSEKAVELAHKFDIVYAAVGLHPENVEEFDAEFLPRLENLAKEKKVVAIGEIGLDYYWLKDLSESELKKQKQLQKLVFERQILLANRLKLPIVVHCRDAMGDTIEILQKIKPVKESLMHCYSGSLESAKILMKLGFSFSFGGVVTFKNAKNVKEVAKELPLGRILLETDCPYLSPEPFRSKRNEPQNVVYVADEISRLKNLSIEEVAKSTTENSRRLFGI